MKTRNEITHSAEVKLADMLKICLLMTISENGQKNYLLKTNCYPDEICSDWITLANRRRH